MSSSSPLPFFLSREDACPYGLDQKERKLFTKLTGNPETDARINAILTRAGFRRSMDVVYRPDCPSCRACVPVRLNCGLFQPSRSQRRTMRHNADLVAQWRPARATASLYDLFHAYVTARHENSDMADMDWLAFRAMIEEGDVPKSLLLLKEPTAHRPLGGMLVDDVGEGFSAVYSFFDPREGRRSLGTQLILSLIDKAKEEGKAWVYLGYWIEGAPVMAYKAAFQPLEAIGNKEKELAH